MAAPKKRDYVITVPEASTKSAPYISGGLHFPTKETYQRYEEQLEVLELRTYWEIRERHGIWATNQNKFVSSYADLNEWDNPTMEHRCVAVYGPRGFNLMEFLRCEMPYSFFCRVQRWKAKPVISEFLALSEDDVMRWPNCGIVTWAEVERCQRLYVRNFGLKFDLWTFLEKVMPEVVLSDLREIGIETVKEFMALDETMTHAYSSFTWEHVRNAQRRLEAVYGNHQAIPGQEKEAQANGRRKGAGRKLGEAQAPARKASRARL